MHSSTEINRYLALEFGFDDESAEEPSEGSPFVLRALGSLSNGARVFDFKDGEDEYFVIDGQSLNFLPKANLSIGELDHQELGAAWIGRQDPIDLNTSKLGDRSVPSVLERKRKLLEIASSALKSPEILEGLYLQKSRSYLCLAQDASGRRVILGSNVPSVECPSRQLSPWRELSIQVGKLIAEKALPNSG